MIGDDGEKSGIATLLPFVAAERRPEFVSHVVHIIEEESYAFDHNFLGFIGDYINYADLLQCKVDLHYDHNPPWERHRKKPPITVYDVGCAHALQHLVFDPRVHYVGIDVYGCEPKFFRENCTFIKGSFKEVVGSLKIDREHAIGIANMSLIYFAGDEECALFDKTFKRKFVL